MEWNYDLSWALNSVILSGAVDFEPHEVKQVILEVTDPRDDTCYHWLLELKDDVSSINNRFVYMTSTQFGSRWLYNFFRRRYTFNAVTIEAPIFIQLGLKTDESAGWLVYTPKSLTVGQIIQDRKNKAVRLGHLRDVTMILSNWVKLVQSEGYT